MYPKTYAVNDADFFDAIFPEIEPTDNPDDGKENSREHQGGTVIKDDINIRKYSPVEMKSDLTHFSGNKNKHWYGPTACMIRWSLMD